MHTEGKYCRTFCRDLQVLLQLDKYLYKNTTLYNLMKINYVYVIHYVDYLFDVRHCVEADELFASV